MPPSKTAQKDTKNFSLQYRFAKSQWEKSHSKTGAKIVLMALSHNMPKNYLSVK